ncbi:hypothetical protein IEO21_05430 [Rhodonia placenta]|uniref:TNase-like domain-containing protein n=1 Tax=Rhodonia placenta TaxID=104341 RepID=A0A8H7U1L9_9APHY|nr:hypothetical protein IEO21_05430 [Postia placenta]
MASLPWPWRQEEIAHNTKESSPDLQLRQLREEAATAISELESAVFALPPHLLALCALCIGSAGTISARYIYRRYWKRIPSAEWVTPDILKRRRWIKGYVTSVGDADNFRLYHMPGLGWRWPLKFRLVPPRKDLREQTIHIRLAGVDAPEAAHFGNPAQPFAEESLSWLKGQIEGQTVYCQLIRKDQYGRIVSQVHLKPRVLPGFLVAGRNLSLEMLRAGWAETYEQAGAEYGRWGSAEFLRLQAEAQAARRGIWKYGLDLESAADYKRRHAAAGTSKMAKEAVKLPVATPPVQDDVSRIGQIRRLLVRVWR